jgi:hypothetical protein
MINVPATLANLALQIRVQPIQQVAKVTCGAQVLRWITQAEECGHPTTSQRRATAVHGSEDDQLGMSNDVSVSVYAERILLSSNHQIETAYMQHEGRQAPPLDHPACWPVKLVRLRSIEINVLIWLAVVA